jgi:subfamily B ATP-binding cassette protein HlyB/CyaB
VPLIDGFGFIGDGVDQNGTDAHGFCGPDRAQNGIGQKELQEGYDTIVGERGASLSGGQRQRIAIARALVTNPRILIFDEATSALDYESERVIQDNMARIAQGRTVFVIAHRLSTVRRSHRIITIDRGRLVEDGTHEELINQGGRYAALHRVQAGVHEVS